MDADVCPDIAALLTPHAVIRMSELNMKIVQHDIMDVAESIMQGRDSSSSRSCMGATYAMHAVHCGLQTLQLCGEDEDNAFMAFDDPLTSLEPGLSLVNSGVLQKNGQPGCKIGHLVRFYARLGSVYKTA
jgi:hypothetical protein